MMLGIEPKDSCRLGSRDFSLHQIKGVQKAIRVFSVHLGKLRELPKFGIIFWWPKGGGSMQEILEAQNVYGNCTMRGKL